MPKALLATYAIAFTICAAGGEYLAQTVGLAFFRTLAMLLGWGALVSIASVLPRRLPFGLRPILLLLGTIAVVAVPGRFYLPAQAVFASVTDDGLRLIAVVLAIVTFILHFLATYGAHSRRESPHPALDTLVPLARLIAAALAATVAVLIALLYFQKLWVRQAEILFGAITAALMVEAALQAIARLYLPKRLRGDAPFGHGVLLSSLFGQAGPLQSLSVTLEKTFGVKLRETWLVRLGANLAAPFVPLLLLGLWLSTGVTRIPVDSRGVLLRCGEFQKEALRPGLHFHAPWPFASVTLVVTEKVGELALGFERDLSLPVLWAETHFAGEQNLLVGGGEELLTVNVPVHYRVRDAVAFLRRTGDSRTALTSLGYHELLAVTGSHDSFGLMITDREEVAASLRTGLQTAADRLQLGIEILFVGLKDVHPPVDVAPAFQDVVSAEEQRISLVDQARTHTVTATAEARITALQTRIGSEAAATERLSRATGEASRFLAPVPVWSAHPDVLATRLRLEALVESFDAIRQLYILPAGTHQHSTFLLGNSAAASGTPAPVIRPASPVIKKIPAPKP